MIGRLDGLVATRRSLEQRGLRMPPRGQRVPSPPRGQSLRWRNQRVASKWKDCETPSELESQIRFRCQHLLRLERWWLDRLCAHNPLEHQPFPPTRSGFSALPTPCFEWIIFTPVVSKGHSVLCACTDHPLCPGFEAQSESEGAPSRGCSIRLVWVHWDASPLLDRVVSEPSLTFGIHAEWASFGWRPPSAPVRFLVPGVVGIGTAGFIGLGVRIDVDAPARRGSVCPCQHQGLRHPSE